MAAASSALARTSSADAIVGTSFSRDGQRIAYSSYSSSDPDIFTIRPDGSDQRQVTFSRGSDVDPAFSGDSSRIAFETDRNGNVDIYSVDASGVGRGPAHQRAGERARPGVVADGEQDRVHGRVGASRRSGS